VDVNELYIIFSTTLTIQWLKEKEKGKDKKIIYKTLHKKQRSSNTNSTKSLG